MMKVIISGGGTGGHIYPAIAIAQALKAAAPKTEILFVGATGKMEMEKVPKAGFPIVGLPMRGLQRNLSLDNLKFPFRLLSSLWKAKKIIADFHPDICIGVGGYASAAVLQMAVLAGIPTLIQEQNSYAGLTNKWLSKFANKICVAYPDMATYFPAHKLVYCGNPVRQDLLTVASLKPAACNFFGLAANKQTVLVIGARSINEAMLASITELLRDDIQVLWQTGSTDFERIKQHLATMDLPNKAQNLVLKDFVYEMQYAYSVADIVVSRAGALALSELALAAKPAILIPFPHAAEDHQTKNALSYVNKQAALHIKDSEAKDKLGEVVGQLLANTQLQHSLAANIKTFAQPQAAKLIAQEVLALAKK
jgi:UDP-N-acetylglucosamine--N-acetylmuramyl-(pentapeptide) pyrophosphoryl-undecaprenol N-acetylglucosamine transferase